MADNRREENLEKIRKLSTQVRQGTGLQHDLEIDFVTSTGEVLTGTVVVHRPSMAEYLQMGVIKGRYISKYVGKEYVRPEYIDSTIQYLAHMLATMQVVVDQCPPWFMDLENLRDFDVLNHVYTQYEQWVNSFRTGSTEPTSGDSETTERA